MVVLRVLSALILVLVAALSLAACGGDDDDGGSGDEAAVTDTIETSINSTDPADCTKLATQRFLEQTEFETGDAAVASCEENAADTSDDPDSVEVSDVSVDGETATADVTFSGSAFDGSTLSVDLTKEADQWKLDAITDIPTFNRAAFDQEFARQLGSGEDAVPAEIADCISQSLGQTDDEQVKTAILSGNQEELLALFGSCISGG